MSRQLSIALSKDMMPTAKIVAYYITPGGYVVADSLSFHIQPNRKNQVREKRVTSIIVFTR